MAHDYRCDDYEIDPRPSPEVVAEVQATLRRHARVIKHFRLSNPTVYYVKSCGRRDLARYVNGTRDEPVFVVNAKAIIRSATKYGVLLRDGVEGTIMHEVGHAYIDSCGANEELPREKEEELVEEFAHLLWEGYTEAAIELLEVACTNTTVGGSC